MQSAETEWENFQTRLACFVRCFTLSFSSQKHLEHERKQITVSDTGVPVSFHLSVGPKGTLPVFHRAGYVIGAVTAGAPEAQAAAPNRVAFSL